MALPCSLATEDKAEHSAGIQGCTSILYLELLSRKFRGAEGSAPLR